VHFLFKSFFFFDDEFINSYNKFVDVVSYKVFYRKDVFCMGLQWFIKVIVVLILVVVLGLMSHGLSNKLLSLL
jgi:hypothetical protein